MDDNFYHQLSSLQLHLSNWKYSNAQYEHLQIAAFPPYILFKNLFFGLCSSERSYGAFGSGSSLYPAGNVRITTETDTEALR